VATVVITPPDLRSIRRVGRRFADKDLSWVYLGQRPDEFRQVDRNFPGQGDHLVTARKFHAAAEVLREPYLTYLYEIGRKLDSLLWWVTSLSYRNFFMSKTFHQVCFLKVGLDLVKTWDSSQPLILVVADAPVRRALAQNLDREQAGRTWVVGSNRSSAFQPVLGLFRMLAFRAFFLLREGRRVIQSRRFVASNYAPIEDTTLIISTIHAQNIHRAGEFHTAAWGNLAAQLGELGCHVAIMPMVLRNVKYKEALHQAKDSGLPLMIPHRYLNFLDLIWAVIMTLRKPPSPRSVPVFSGMDITALVKEDLRQHWIVNRAPDALLYVSLMRRWAALGLPLERIIYIYENQPWERAICWEARRSLPKTALVGYQHARVPRFILNWHLAPDGEPDAPLPDFIVTVGKHTAHLLSSHGYDEERIRVGGALQMQGLAELSTTNSEPRAAGTAPVVLVAPAAGREEAAEVVEMAVRLFNEDDGVQVIVKCHPSMPFSRFESLLDGKLPNHAQMSQEPITDLMLKSSLLLYTGSTVCVQALALGLPVVYVRPQFDLGMDALEAEPDLRLEAMGPKELGEKVRWLLDHREEYIEQHKDAWNRFLEEMYGPVTERSFRAFIDRVWD